MTAIARAPRRTQLERSTATRQRLLDATIECLIEHGYSGTTVARVAERAQVTRGGQVHHYPTKEQLVLAAVTRLAELRTQDTLRTLDDLRPGPDWVNSLLDVLWDSHHRGDLFVATAELWLAARTDPHLAAHLGDVERIATPRVAVDAHQQVQALFGNEAAMDALYTAMDAIRGLVMSTWHLPEEEVNSRWQRAKRQLHMMFPAPT